MLKNESPFLCHIIILQMYTCFVSIKSLLAISALDHFANISIQKHDNFSSSIIPLLYYLSCTVTSLVL